MKLKIVNMQMESYAKYEKLPSLQYISDKLCEDEDMEYVKLKGQTTASLEHIDTTGHDSIFTKLKEYPYEFEIDSKIQLASINGEKISTIVTTRGYPVKIENIAETETKKEFSYTGDYQEYIVPEDGYYKVECWGASGGNAGSYSGGKGAYTSGIIYLEKSAKLYIYIGGKGIDGVSPKKSDGGYNGGGNVPSEIWWSTPGSGGGATDIRLENGSCDNFDSLKSRIMVAAGGGGAIYHSGGAYWGGAIGGVGGTFCGINGNNVHLTKVPAQGGTQTSGGLSNSGKTEGKGSFGHGGNANFFGAGGSGYYGGGAALYEDNYLGSGAGGSSFISGYGVCDAISATSTEEVIEHTGSSIHYSGRYFILSKMLAGNESMPNYNSEENMVGNTGNGYARIIKVDLK